MSRASFAVFLAVSLAVIQAGTVRPAAQAGPTPQAGATQDAGQQPAAAQPPAQGDAAQQPQPTFRAGVNFVRVDVIVHDNKGQPVSDLTQADFEVLEDGKVQAVDSLEFVRIEPGQPTSSRRDPNNTREMLQIAADPHNRVFVVFLDGLHTAIDGSHNIRGPLVNALNRIIGPNDLFGVTTHLQRPRDLVLGRRLESVEDQLTRYWTWGIRQSILTDPADPAEDALKRCFEYKPGVKMERWLVDELFIITQPAHLQKRFSEKLSAEERDLLRADMLRDRLKSVSRPKVHSNGSNTERPPEKS